MASARVLIADDHAIVRERLVTLLENEFDVVGAVADGKVLIETAVRLKPDVVVVDLSMPGLTAFEALRQLKAARLDAKVIVFTMYAEAGIVTEALRLGASGFVLKLSAGDELVIAINEVMEGRIFLTPSLREEVNPSSESQSG